MLPNESILNPELTIPRGIRVGHKFPLNMWLREGRGESLSTPDIEQADQAECLLSPKRILFWQN